MSTDKRSPRLSDEEHEKRKPWPDPVTMLTSTGDGPTFHGEFIEAEPIAEAGGLS